MQCTCNVLLSISSEIYCAWYSLEGDWIDNMPVEKMDGISSVGRWGVKLAGLILWEAEDLNPT